MHYVVDLRTPEDAVVFLINSRGEVFTYALEVTDDPHPERGARKGLTSEGVVVIPSAHVPMGDGSIKYISINIAS